jgi:hypothetical protein
VTPRYFKNGGAFRAWLAKHHASRFELTLGFYKRHSTKKLEAFAPVVGV